MEGRLGQAVAAHGMADGEWALIRGALREAMAPREPSVGILPSEEHPDFLHPGRTVLILLSDLELRVPELLVLGALAESRNLRLRLSEAVILSRFRSRWVEEWLALPLPPWREAPATARVGELLEALVLASREVRTIVLAEALDHLRHAHLLESAEEQVATRTLAESVYAPLASRTDPVLERRLQWWVRRVGSRLPRLPGSSIVSESKEDPAAPAPADESDGPP